MRRKLLVAILLAPLIFSSGCGALVLLGVGGTAGYMIKKGEDSGGGGGKKAGGKSKSTSSAGAPVLADTKAAPASD